ncbi:MAG TPA: hypothetical protein VL501_07815, partial [Pyrinomonadaceae bacterium]|nr:hypothetical protein [Pyrinomonadaceae bacterium]
DESGGFVGIDPCNQNRTTARTKPVNDRDDLLRGFRLAIDDLTDPISEPSMMIKLSEQDVRGSERPFAQHAHRVGDRQLAAADSREQF